MKFGLKYILYNVSVKFVDGLYKNGLTFANGNNTAPNGSFHSHSSEPGPIFHI